MSKIETGNFEITPEPFAPAQVINSCCAILDAAGARGGRYAGKINRRRSAGNDRRQARAQPNSAQSGVERDPFHRSRRQGHGQRPCRGGRYTFAVEDNGVGIGDEDLARVGEPYFQAAQPPTIAAMAAPASDFPSSRAWCGCTAANFHPQPGRRGYAGHGAPAARLRACPAGKKHRRPQPAGVSSYLPSPDEQPSPGERRQCATMPALPRAESW